MAECVWWGNPYSELSPSGDAQLPACALSFVAGVWLLQLRSELPALWPACLLAVPLIALVVALRVRGLRASRLIVACLTSAAMGFFWAAWFAQQRLADELPALWESRDIHLVGVIAKLPQSFERGIRFELDVERVLTADAKVPSRISLSWYGTWNQVGRAGTVSELHVGERWQFAVRLRRPHGTANPHGFDYEAWLLERGIRATGYVRAQATPIRVEPFVVRPGYVVERLREVARARILAALPDHIAAGVIAALVMGDQRAITSEQWTTFTRTGVNHLVSISGLHITMIAALLFALVDALWRHSVRLTLALPARKAAVICALGGALFYAAIAGFAVPAQRTVYMLSVAAVALWLGQISSAAAVLCAALFVVTVLDPWAVLAPGFWLSFGAVALILYVSLGRLRPPHWLIVWMRTQWAVTLGLVPALLVLFQQVSLVSPIANAFAIPVISWIVVPIALIGTVMPAPIDFVLRLAHEVMAYTLRALEWLASAPDGVWQQHAPLPWAVLSAFVGIAWMLLPRGFPGRWCGFVLIVPLFTAVPRGPDYGSAWVTVLDVGQGLAVVIRTASHTLLYDTGPYYSQEADSGNRIVVPFLRAVGVRRLDGIIITHADNDHAGGAGSVAAAVPIGWLASSIPPEHPLHAAIGDSRPCFAGQRWQWDGVDFEMLHPSWHSYTVPAMRANDRSCVLRVEALGRRILLAGDAEARSEREMLARVPEKLQADILVVPHHGSTTSSSVEFIAGVRPEVAVFTVGYRNRFGHPRPEILQRYLDYGSRLLRTDHHGALSFDIEPGSVHLRAHRAERKRYWQDPIAIPASPRANGGDMEAAYELIPSDSGSN